MKTNVPASRRKSKKPGAQVTPRSKTVPAADSRADPLPGLSPQLWPDWAICLGLFFFAYAIRLVYLFQIESMPVFYQLPGDPRTYDQWAQTIAAGDWIGDRIFYQAPLYPYFLGFLETVFGHNLWVIRVVQIGMSAAIAGFLYVAGKAFFTKGAGNAAG